jgi:predicted nucleic acid-binding protein
MAASHADADAAETSDKPTLLVLDTNVVLDWLVFRNPGVLPLAGALEAGTVTWVACPRMREELSRTLAYPLLRAWSPDSAHALACFDRLAVVSPEPPLPQASQMLCSDPDDQVFIELALAHHVTWLLTRDRALLKLKRRAVARGLRIAPPESWVAEEFLARCDQGQ